MEEPDPEGAPPRPSGALSSAESRLLVLAGAPALPSSHRRAPASSPEPEPSLEWARASGLYTQPEAEAVLEALLLEPTGTVASALCQAVPSQDEFMTALLEFFEANGRGYDLVVSEMTAEVKRTAEIHLLFRGRSAAARFVTHYVRLASDEYLSRIVNWIISEIRPLPQPLEIDPNASPPPPTPAARDASLAVLRTITGALLDRLVNGPAPPLPLRRLAHDFISVVSAQFPKEPEVGLVALGAFFFLRILCPAIAVASAQLVPHERRALTLISKVLQQEANGVPFSEPFMAPLTPLIALHRPLIATLLQTLPMAPPPQPQASNPPPLRVAPARKSLSIIATRISALLVEILPQLRTAPVRASRPVAYSPFPRLIHILSVHPPIAAATPPSLSNSASSLPSPSPSPRPSPSIPIPSPRSGNNGSPANSPSVPTASSSSPGSSSPSSLATEPTSGSTPTNSGSKRSGLALKFTSGLVAIGRSGRLVLRLIDRDSSPSHSAPHSSSSPAPSSPAKESTAASPPLSSSPSPLAASSARGHSPSSPLTQALCVLLTNKHVASALLSLAAQHKQVSVVVRPLIELAGPGLAPRLIKRLLKSGRTALATSALRTFAASAWTDFLRTSLSSSLSESVSNLAAAEKTVAADAERLELDNFATSGLLRDAASLLTAVTAAFSRAPPLLLTLARVLHAQRNDESAVAEFVIEGAFTGAITSPDEWHLLPAGHPPLKRVTRTLLELLSKMLLLASLGLSFRAPNSALIDHFLLTEGATLRVAFHTWLTSAAAAPEVDARAKAGALNIAIAPLNSLAAFASEHRQELNGPLSPLQLLESPVRPLDAWLRLLFAAAPSEV